jgi:hypothetical protein
VKTKGKSKSTDDDSDEPQPEVKGTAGKKVAEAAPVVDYDSLDEDEEDDLPVEDEVAPVDTPVNPLLATAKNTAK